MTTCRIIVIASHIDIVFSALAIFVFLPPSSSSLPSAQQYSSMQVRWGDPVRLPYLCSPASILRSTHEVYHTRVLGISGVSLEVQIGHLSVLRSTKRTHSKRKQLVDCKTVHTNTSYVLVAACCCSVPLIVGYGAVQC